MFQLIIPVFGFGLMRTKGGPPTNYHNLALFFLNFPLNMWKSPAGIAQQPTYANGSRALDCLLPSMRAFVLLSSSKRQKHPSPHFLSLSNPHSTEAFSK